jgi:hypothetical protein
MNPMYFQVLSPQQANPMGYGMQQGAQSAGLMQDARLKAIQAALANAQVPYAGQMAQADLAMKQAQVPYVQSQTAMNIGTLPYLGMKYYGPMLSAQAKMMQAGIANQNSFRGYAQTPQGAAVLQNDPNMANTFQNAMQDSASMINGGGMQQQPPQPGAYNNPASYPQLPGAQTGQPGTPINPQQINQLRQLAQPGVPDVTAAIQNASGLLAQHKTTDASARQKNLYAANIDKTFDNINVNDLTQYSGIPGIAELQKQKALAAVGKESPGYDNYLKSLNASSMLATQVRQFYGDSIQPTMIQRLEQLTNPSTWSNNPALAKNLFNTTKQILNQETGTYRQAMQSTAPYQAQQSPVNSVTQNQAGGYQVKGLGGKQITLTDADIAHTAQLHGLTIAQVKQQLGIS